MRLSLPYGEGCLETEAPAGTCLGTLDVADAPEVADVAAAVREALDNPIGLGHGIQDVVRPGETVAILVSDSFRETGSQWFLPVLADVLNDAGVPDESITIVFATGTHRPPTPEEEVGILGPAFAERFAGRRFTHDANDRDNLSLMGTTSRGTPVWINKRARDHDRLILTGAVVLHYYGGYGGGRKSIIPGISGIETIAHNHAMNLDPDTDRLNPDVRIGALDGNPVAEDMLEGARLARPDFLLNTVLNRAGRIAGVFGGDLDAAHRAAAAFARDLFAIRIRERADLVIAASSRTRNYVQTHKALFNAYQAVKPGGRIVLAAPCAGGVGGEQFVQWIRLGNRAAVIAALRRKSEINGQTALSTLEKTPITVMVTEMSDADVALLGARKAASLEHALALVRGALPERPTYYVMPSAAFTVPFPDED